MHTTQRFLFACLLALAGTSCKTLTRLASDVASIRDDVRIVGRIGEMPTERNSVHVLVCKSTGSDGVEVIDQASPNAMGDVVFVLPDTSDYHLVATQDQNNNSRYDPGEPLWIHGGATPCPVSVTRGETPPSVDIKLSQRSAPDAFRGALSEWRAGEVTAASGAVTIACGDIIDLDDHTFTDETGSEGMWAPVTAARRNGMGIYFLQDYDPAKIPVIFVHGIGGSPANWEPVAAELDPAIYQAWFYSYPTGLRLESAALGLTRLTARLHAELRFDELHVVAHSMGGLVARRFIQLSADGHTQNFIRSFTSLSTPWNGVKSASSGVKHFSTPIPSWKDLQPNSDFIENLLAEALPVPHLLVYTDKASRRFTLPKENDGTVSVASQLDTRAESHATHVQQIHADHEKILKSDEAIGLIDQFIRAHAFRTPSNPAR